MTTSSRATAWGGTLGDLLAEVHDHHPIRDAEEKWQDVLDDDDGDAALAEGEDQPLDLGQLQGA